MSEGRRVGTRVGDLFSDSFWGGVHRVLPLHDSDPRTPLKMCRQKSKDFPSYITRILKKFIVISYECRIMSVRRIGGINFFFQKFTISSFLFPSSSGWSGDFEE